MYTVSELVRLLGLATENQVRNRIEAVRDLLAGAIRRGPNNQLLVTEEGLAILRSLQALCESGHTLKEAASILRYDSDPYTKKHEQVYHETRKNQAEGWEALVGHLAEEVRDLSRRLSALEARVRGWGDQPWWEAWR
jgi:hypothetical protein